ncbi:hypothetical protein ACHAQA_003658 [Verticillium albo-atrum]
MPDVDPAILDALGLAPEHTSIASHGGSGFSSTFKLTSTLDGQPKHYFIKTGAGKPSEVMFRGEHASLNAIASAVPSFCPSAHAHGPLANTPDRFFLATDFLDLRTSATSRGSGPSLAAKLAKLHTTPAPTPDGFDGPMFGFPVPTCCGSTPQENGFRASWADFYAENRLRAICRAGVAANGPDAELESAVERVAAVVTPRLVGDATMPGIVPVVVHGDLWSGNHGTGQIHGQGGAEEVVFDSSAVYGHAEYELGIMRMFGGFGAAFWREYEELVPRAEPKGEWDDRVKLYEL